MNEWQKGNGFTDAEENKKINLLCIVVLCFGPCSVKMWSPHVNLAVQYSEPPSGPEIVVLC